MSGPPDWAAVLFDLDGTLADTVPLILRCYRHTMRTHLGEEPPDERWLATIGTPLDVQLRDFARDADEAAAMLDTYVSFQRTVHDDMVCAYEGARGVMEGLRARGIRVGVVTSKRRVMALRTLGSCGVEDLVDVLVAADDVERPKPDPEPVRTALAGLEVEGSEDRVVFVGDSPFDMRAGREAGVLTAAALWGPFAREVLEGASPDHWLERLGDVLEIRPSATDR